MEAIGEDGNIRLEHEKEVGECLSGYTYFRDEDVCVAKITPCFENGKGAILRELKGGVGFGTTELIVARPNKEKITSEFIDYLFRSQTFRRLGESEMYGAGGQKRVPESFVRDFTSALPSIEEQRQVTTFLDHQTAKIDALIAEQQRLIELLQEKRQAVISHAVTKGLNPTAPMKDSGVEWLGEVPEHWALKKIKHTARMESGHTPDRKVEAYWVNCDIPWVSLNDTSFLKDNDYISETTHSINELGIQNSSARLLPERVVVFSRDATIGRCAITTRPMAVSQHFIAWVCGEEILPEYLLLRLKSMTQELERLTFGATLKTIGMPDVKTLVTPVPPPGRAGRDC
jgi:type I restriction enzyme S subunit